MADVEGRRRDRPIGQAMSAGSGRKHLPGSHLRAEAPAFRPEELPRPANLRNLKTRRQHSRLEALDLVPFTPSQGVLTPSPNNYAVTGHEHQVYALYPATPQAATSVAFTEQGSMQSGSDESSSHSFASAFSPFHWPLPVSPTAFPVRQGQYVLGPVMDSNGQPTQYQSWVTSNAQDLVYPFPLQPGSPMYVSPDSPLVGAAWNRQTFSRQRSRLSGAVMGPILVVQGSGSPAYSGMSPGDYPRGLAMTVFPVPGSPTYGAAPSSPAWAGGPNVGPFSLQPSTPPHGSKVPRPFASHFPLTPELTDQPRSGAMRESTPDSIATIPGLLSAAVFSRPPADQHLPRMNARQRRTLRRAQEREAKQRAELEARQRTEMMVREQSMSNGSDQPLEGNGSLQTLPSQDLGSAEGSC